MKLTGRRGLQAALLLGVIGLLGAIGLVGCYRYVFTERRVILSETTDERLGQFLVTGQSDDLIFDGWRITFCWRRHGGPWMTYYLDHESRFWRDVELSTNGNTVCVKRGGQLMGRHNTEEGSFYHSRHNSTASYPGAIIPSEDPFAGANRQLSHDGAGWSSVWPDCLRAGAKKEGEKEGGRPEKGDKSN